MVLKNPFHISVTIFQSPEEYKLIDLSQATSLSPFKDMNIIPLSNQVRFDAFPFGGKMSRDLINFKIIPLGTVEAVSSRSTKQNSCHSDQIYADAKLRTD